MKTFKDGSGQTWDVIVDVNAIKRVRTLMDVDLLTVTDEECKLLIEMTDDVILFIDILYCICKPQCDKRDMSDEDFGGCLIGDAILQAQEAVFAGITDFFQRPEQRAALKKVTTLISKVQKGMMNQLKAGVKEMGKLDVDKIVDDAIKQSGNVPESLASTPDLSPSLSCSK